MSLPAALLASAVALAAPADLGYAVRFDRAGLDGVEGDPLSAPEREEALERLGAYTGEYPEGFVARYVREVVVLSDLRVDGIPARGHRRHRVVLVEFRSRAGHVLARRDFDHEVFHALDGHLREVRLDPAWEDERRRALHLRDLWDDYRITPSHRYSFSWDRTTRTNRKLPWMAFVPVVGLIWVIPHALGGDGGGEGFAYPHGRVAPREDRAAVAEALLSGDEEFLRRAAADDELREKVAIVKAMYRAGSEGAIDDGFWNRLAEGQFEVPSLAALEEKLMASRGRGRGGAVGPGAAGGGDDPPTGDPPIVVATLPRPAVVAVADDAGGPVRVPADPAAAPSTGPAPGAGRERAAASARATGTPRPSAPGGARGVPAIAAPRVVAAVPETASGAASSPADAYQEGLAAFRSGDHAGAARRWREMLEAVDPGHATVQVAINCVIANVEKSQKALAGKASFYMLEVPRGDRTCWLTLSGLYRTAGDASLAIAGLPAEIRAQSPRPALVRDVLRGAR